MTTTTYALDTTHSSIEFSIRHLVIAKVRGRFTRFTGQVTLDGADVTASQVTATIDAASIDTSEPKRDDHLRSADFFDVATYPELRFASTRIERRGGELRLTGDLTIHGVTNEVVLTVEALGTATDPWGNARVAFAATGAISRKDFGLAWNQVLEAGGFLVGDRVDLTLDVQAVATAAQVAA
jgi:polyisoprenoid-binding protein YceI